VDELNDLVPLAITFPSGSLATAKRKGATAG